jgi:hypothetical protein
MSQKMLVVLLYLYYFGGSQLVQSRQSKLRVAVCSPGMLPFATKGTGGEFEGYDIGTVAVYDVIWTILS